MSIARRFNTWLADHLADALASMVLFWLVTFAVILPLLWQRPENAVLWIIYASSTCFQAVALPVLAFVSKKEGVKQAKILQETHDAVMQELGVLKEMHLEAAEERRMISGLCSIRNIL